MSVLSKDERMNNTIKKFSAVLICSFVSIVSFSQYSKAPVPYQGALLYNQSLIHPQLTKKYYGLNGHRLMWVVKENQAKQLREQLIKNIDSTVYFGLNPLKYHLAELRGICEADEFTDSAKAFEADELFTDAFIALCKDIYAGVNISQWITYDEFSKKYEATDDDYLLNKLTRITKGYEIDLLLQSLEPSNTRYHTFKNELFTQVNGKNVAMMKQLSLALNFQRWINHFRFDSYIVINIPSATLRYYQEDTIALQMKVVVGKPSTTTPRFAAQCDEVILYPYWNVPSSIALNELLPKVKRNPAVLNEMNMQVVNSKGMIISPFEINWSRLNKKYFPYRFRQSTGCDNSLGVIKFNITDPYSVYMHDTNNKTAFLSGYRFYSHGCIRVEQPMQLGNILLNNQLDTAFLQACYKKQEPVQVSLKNPVPVFVVYHTADTDAAGRIKFYKDVYGILK